MFRYFQFPISHFLLSDPDYDMKTKALLHEIGNRKLKEIAQT